MLPHTVNQTVSKLSNILFENIFSDVVNILLHKMEEFSKELMLPSKLSSFLLMATEYYDFQNDSRNYISGESYDNFTNSSEVWSSDNHFDFKYGAAWSIILICAYLLVLIVGMIGNILVILVIFLKPPMHPVTNMFLLNLAVADLLVILFCVPATLISNLFNSWIMGLFMCKGAAYVQGVAVCASAFSLAALSLDRCKATLRPIERHQGQGITKCQALSVIGLIWIFSLIITLPWLFVFEVTEEDGQIYCEEVWENEFLGKMFFIVTHLTCCFVVPFSLIFSSNGVIWYHVSKRPGPENSVCNQRSQRKMRDGVRKTLGAVTAAFLICWCPLYLIVTIMKFLSPESLREWENVFSVVLPTAQWLGSLNSCMNPVLYAFINTAFRKGFRSLLSSCIRH